ncbi:MAG: 1-deoxy-D-xylulose-5-phosphate synthase [Candidatus Omnitrophica bacterium]|nr:1-deoxy-D-xylulose-5-phosphate synthase [Candidatus Omnitrophota bacterium]
MANKTQRDVFFDRVYELARVDRDVIIVSADMSAPALDKFRRDLPMQFVNVGIAEQNAILIASGLAKEGKKVFCYAIAPFITLRCLEQIRVNSCINEIPITIVGMGVGLGYHSDGPTHHLIEDVAIMRSFPGINILNTTDNIMAASLVSIAANSSVTNYIRLDKDFHDDVYSAGADFSSGLNKIKEGRKMIVATGAMVHSACEIAASDYGVIDLFQIPINREAFIEAINGVEKIITLEEHFLAGGMGSAVCELFNDCDIKISVKRLGLNARAGYESCYKYGGREIIRDNFGLGFESIKEEANNFFK